MTSPEDVSVPTLGPPALCPVSAYRYALDRSAWILVRHLQELVSEAFCAASKTMKSIEEPATPPDIKRMPRAAYARACAERAALRQGALMMRESITNAIRDDLATATRRYGESRDETARAMAQYHGHEANLADPRRTT
jgi:hypothetical protein